MYIAVNRNNFRPGEWHSRRVLRLNRSISFDLGKLKFRKAFAGQFEHGSPNDSSSDSVFFTRRVDAAPVVSALVAAFALQEAYNIR